MRRTHVFILTVVTVLLAAPAASASHSLVVTAARTGFLLSSSAVQVRGTLTCVGGASTGSIGVVLIQPPGGVALTGGGSTDFACTAGERVFWGVVVEANDPSMFALGRARFDVFASTRCSDDDVDCPSSGIDGTLEIVEPPTCFGEPATIVGHDGDERIEGTSGADVIVTRGGSDVVFAGGGDDVICGNSGADIIDAGGGNDRASGAAGRDFITGVDGHDEIRGGAGNDVLNFGDEENGDDVVSGGRGDDDLHAGVGRDRLFGRSGNDTLQEGEVDGPLIDLFSGGAGIDTCSPGPEDVVRECEP